MKKIINLSLLLMISLFITNCGENEKETFPVSKRYWTPEEYNEVTRTLRFGFQPDEKLPTFDNPETRIVVEKYTDPQNYLVILEDNELGTKYKDKIAEDFFREWRDMVKVYTARDRKDKFLYEKEMLKVFQFGLGLQLYYFDIGNKEILERVDNPADAKNTVRNNIQTLINNYKIYLDFINDEKSFSEEGLKLFSDGLVEYYTKLIEKFPDADYSSTKAKMLTLKKKAKSEKIKNALDRIIKLIDNKSNSDKN